MESDVSAAAAGGSARRVRSEGGWQALMVDSGRRDGSQAGFREARGVSVKTFRRRRRGLTAGAPAAGTGGFAEIKAEETGPGCGAVARRRGHAPPEAALMPGGWPASGIRLAVESADMRGGFDGPGAPVPARSGENPAGGRRYVSASRAGSRFSGGASIAGRAGRAAFRWTGRRAWRAAPSRRGWRASWPGRFR